MGKLFTHVLKILGPGDLKSGRQVIKRGTMTGQFFNYLYVSVPPTVSDQFLSNFQEMLCSPRCTTYGLFFILLT